MTTDLPVHQLGLSAVALERATSLELSSAERLAAKSEADLLRLGFTTRQITNIRECLGINGLRLAMPPDHNDAAEQAACTAIDVGSQPALIEIGRRASGPVPPPTAGELVDDADLRNVRDQDLDDEEKIPDYSVSELFAGGGVPRRTRRGTKATDDQRASKAAEKATETVDKRPTRNHPRVIALRETLTLSVDDVAFLYGVARDTIYDALKNPDTPIVHQRIGRAIVIPTRHVFAMLGLDEP
jgi:hypothetical protein